MAQSYQAWKNGEQSPFLKLRLSPSPDKLLDLDGEFHIADTTRPQLYIVGVYFSSVTTNPHFTQRRNRAEIEILPVDEWLEFSQQRFACIDVSGARARLDERIPFPVTSLGGEIILHGREVHDQRTACSKRTQSHVHAKHKAVFRNDFQCPNKLLTQPNEKLLVGIAARGVARLGVSEDKIDIRRQIQLPGTEFA